MTTNQIDTIKEAHAGRACKLNGQPAYICPRSLGDWAIVRAENGQTDFYRWVDVPAVMSREGNFITGRALLAL